jgi:two-component system LytT family response regulator
MNTPARASVPMWTHPLRIIVVDDEPHARADLESVLATRADCTLVDSCASGADAVAAVRRHRPDVLLLDIRMPGLDGFGVVEQLERDLLPHVVFVTAYDRYAIEAFRVRALDYLLKPVQPARLDEALARARERIGARRSYWSDVLVRIGPRELMIRLNDVEWIEADTYYARLHTRGRSYLLRERMHVLEARLDPAQFVRVHRSAIVNLSHVRELEHDGHGDHVIVLSTGARVRASQQRWPAVHDALLRLTRPDLLRSGRPV